MHFSATPMTGFQKSSGLLLMGIAILGLIAGLYIALSPTSIRYDIGDGSLRATTALGMWHTVHEVPLTQVHNARELEITSQRRVAGTGRSDFCEGRWNVNELKSVWLATTCVSAVVALDAGDQTWVLSPADRSGFIAALQSGSGTFNPAPGRPMPGKAGLGAIILVPIVFSVWLVARLVRPLAYRIEGGKLVIPAHFKDVSLPLAGAKFKKEALGWGLRTAGTGMPGLLLGRFRFKGKRVQMAARDRKNGITVEHGGRTLYVTPADSDGFIRSLVENGATER